MALVIEIGRRAVAGLLGMSRQDVALMDRDLCPRRGIRDERLYDLAVVESYAHEQARRRAENGLPPFEVERPGFRVVAAAAIIWLRWFGLDGATREDLDAWREVGRLRACASPTKLGAWEYALGDLKRFAMHKLAAREQKGF